MGEHLKQEERILKTKAANLPQREVRDKAIICDYKELYLLTVLLY